MATSNHSQKATYVGHKSSQLKNIDKTKKVGYNKFIAKQVPFSNMEHKTTQEKTNDTKNQPGDARMPVDAVVGITYNCNSRCVMCDIWKMDPQEQLTADDYLRLPTTLKDVNVSGGEPFLRKDIVDIVKNIRTRLPKARIVISSNGFSTKLIEKRLTEILKHVPDIRVGISIDGMQEMHDKVRGIPNGFNKCMETIDMMKRIGVKNIRLAFTAMTINVHEIPKVYDLSRKKGVQFTCAFAQSSDFYFGGKQNFEDPDPALLKTGFQHVIKNELKSLSPKRWVRAFFADGLYHFATTEQQPLESRPGTDFFYLDPNGIVYPSVVHPYKMGNFKDTKDFSELWHGEDATKARGKVAKSTKQYWMICTARSAIRNNPGKVAKWFAKSRLLPKTILNS
jgi:MoaA/NifB/PqqE/SkfB family radical SAM enzyme